MVDVPVNKEVLIWARKERGLSEKEAADRLKLTTAELAELETGAKLPSMAMLDRIAMKYQIPFASLMMPEPLPLARRPADFRTHEGKEPIWDEDLLIALEVVNAQIDFFVEIRDHDPELFASDAIRNYSEKTAAREVAAAERKKFGVTLETQKAWETPAQAFRYWRHIIERAGAFVQIIGVGPENLCRGFSIFDDRAIPAIVINGDETEGPARTFTLLHEYAHLLIRKPGVSDQNQKNGVERWCNQFAAHLLMPVDQFTTDAVAIDPSRKWSDSALRKIATLYNVSMSAVALHLEDAGLAKAGLYDQKVAEWAEQERLKNRNKSKGGMPMPFPERQVHRLGVRHAGIVLDAVDRGDIDTLEAFELTDVNPKWFDDLKEQVAERQKLYGGVR
jgi:Zn-dependent peptidase ImmA (M78 family)/transcriptional regulator with XRE-family HTH domain